jgi:twitching motility protein PilT
MQTGAKFGMQTMDAALVDPVRRGRISRTEAEKRSSNPDELLRLAGGSLDGASSGQSRDRIAYGRR